MNPTIGIDVSKDHLDVGVSETDRVRRLSNTPQGHRALIRQCRQLTPAAIVLEATGGYEQAALTALAKAGLPVCRINPRQVRDFARATGQLAKTDALDARILARAAKVLTLPGYQLPTQAQSDLQALVRRRQALVKLRDSEKNRAAQAAPVAKPSIDMVLSGLEAALQDIEQRIGQLIHSTPELDDRVTRLGQIPGIGTTTAASLVALLPELGQLNRKAIAKLVGVAPLNCDSGTQQGRRATWGGRAAARSSLYMAALVATRHNPAVKALYQRLVGKGKPAKLALVACMRKLLVIANAMLRDQSDWTAQAV